MSEVDSSVFQPGTPAIIEVFGYQQARFPSCFRGYKVNHFLIVDHPMKDGRILSLPESTHCILRFINNGQIIGFQTKVLALIRQPTPMIFLHYPNRIETSQLRREDRYPVILEAICTRERVSGDLPSYPRGTMLNLSTGGCQMEYNEPFEKGSFVYLTIFLPEQEIASNIEAEVKRIEQKGDNYIVGLAFSSIQDTGFELIRNYLQRLQIYRVRA